MNDLEIMSSLSIEDLYEIIKKMIKEKKDIFVEVINDIEKGVKFKIENLKISKKQKKE